MKYQDGEPSRKQRMTEMLKRVGERAIEHLGRKVSHEELEADIEAAKREYREQKRGR